MPFKGLCYSHIVQLFSFNSSPPFKDVFSLTLKQLWFIDTDTNILRMCIHLIEFETVFRCFMF